MRVSIFNDMLRVIEVEYVGLVVKDKKKLGKILKRFYNWGFEELKNLCEGLKKLFVEC